MGKRICTLQELKDRLKCFQEEPEAKKAIQKCRSWDELRQLFVKCTSLTQLEVLQHFQALMWNELWEKYVEKEEKEAEERKARQIKPQDE